MTAIISLQLAQASVVSTQPAFFDLDFWQQLLVTFVGVVIGIPFALWLNRQQVRREEKKRTVESDERGKEIRDVFCRAINKNKSLLLQMAGDLRTDVIYYNVDLAVFESLPSTEVLRATNIAVSEKLAYLRYELTHLHRKVELQLTIYFDGTLRAEVTKTGPGQADLPRYGEMRAQLVGAIQVHIPRIIVACDATLAEISQVRPSNS